MIRRTASNADERDWLASARRSREETASEEHGFDLAILVSTLAASRNADELEYVAHHLWAAAQVKMRREGPA